MGGKTWSAAEERPFWRYCMVRSHKRTERQWEAIRDKTMQEIIAEKLEIMDWTEIANEMQRWADENGEVRRVYTYLSCFEHYYGDVCIRSTARSPNIGSLANQYISDYQEKKRRGLVDNTGDPARSRSQRIKEQLDAAADDMGGVDNRANRIMMMMMMAGRDMVTPARAADNKERRQQKMKSRRDRENSLIIGMEESRTPASDHHVSTVGREDRDADDLPDNGSMPSTAAPERESAIRSDKISLPPLSLLSFPEMPQHGRMSAHHLNRSELFSREYGSEIGVVYDMNGRAYGPRNSYSYGPQQVLKLEQDYSYHNGGQNWQNQGATSDGYLSQRSGSHMPRHSGNSWYLPSMTSVYHQTSINQQSQAQVPTVSGQLAKFHSTYAAQQTTSASSQAQPAQAHALPPMQEFKTANTLLSMQQPDEYHSTHASPVNVANGMGHTNSKSAVAEPAHPEPRDSSDRHAPSVWQGQQSWDNRSGYANNDDYAHATEQTGHTVGHPQAASAKYRQPS